MGNIYSDANNNVERKRPVSASAVVRIVIWSVVFCLLTGLFALAMFREIFGHGGISLGFGGYYYDDDGFSIGNGTTERTITELNIDWVAGDVTVALSDGDRVEIFEDYDGTEANRLRWKVRGSELIVKFREPTWFGEGHADDEKKLTVLIPASMADDLDEIQIETVFSSQNIGVSARELDVSSVSGQVTVVGNYRTVDVETVSGHVKFAGDFRNANFESVSARVDVALQKQADSLDMDTVSGDLTVILPDSTTGFRVDTDSVSGYTDIRGFDCGSSNRWGDGSMEIHMESVSGKLLIEKEITN